MEKIWYKNYPDGVPHEINPDQYESVVAVFEESCQRFGYKTAYENLGATLTYAQLEEKARHFAAYLQKYQFPRGIRFAIMLPNLLQYPIALFGAMRAGMTIVNVNPLYTARELSHILNDAGVEVVLVLANFAHTLAEALPDVPSLKHIFVTQIGDFFPWPKSAIVNFVVKHIKKMIPPYDLPQAISFKKAVKEGKQCQFKPVSLNGEDIAFLQYTGGTTGVSKGAVLTHRNMVANIEQAFAWVHPYLKEGEETIITALPLYHIFSLTANCMLFMKIGAKNVLITNPRDISGFVKILAKAHFTAITGVNTLFNALLHHPNFSKIDFTDLRLTLGGGMAVQHAVAERWKQITGKPLLEAYGLTETSPAATINPLNLDDYNGSIGLPISSTEISIRDDDGNELAIGQSGELCIRGPQVMREYWRRPDETNLVFMPDGFLRTGDMATVDEGGFVHLLERKKDMILVSGFNVYPNEVEAVIAEHPGVLEVAVVGVPSASSGELVKAFVVKKDPDLTPMELREFCRKNLTAYKIPKEIEFRASLPKTNVGKILRRALREEASA